MTPLRAAPLRPNDPLLVVAPSGPVAWDRIRRSLALLEREGIEAEVDPQVRVRTGYFAGPDRQRLEALTRALQDRRPRTIWPARGGYGLTRLLRHLPSQLPTRMATRMATAPRLLGFSDITALLCAAYVRYGLASMHGPVLAQWAELGPHDRDRTLSMLRGEIPPPLEAAQGPAMLGGQVEGRLIAANLELLRSLVGTPDLPDLRGCILALEDVGERPYRLDRSLTQLLQSGALRGVRGIALGSFHACEPAPDTESPTAMQVLLERLATLQVPVLGGLPFGHTPGSNAALPFGTRVRLHVDHGLLEMLEPIFADTRGA